MRSRISSLAAPILVLALALVVGVPAETWAQGRSAEPGALQWARHKNEVRNLLSQVGEARSDLLAGEYEAALPVTTRLIKRLAPSLTKEDASAFDLMGHLYFLHALALVGTGSGEEGLWYWNMALSFSDSVAGTPVESFGEAGQRLAELSQGGERPCSSPAELRRRADAEDGASHRDGAEGDGGDDGEPPPATSPVQPPVRVHAPAPTYSRAAKWAGLEDSIILQAVIEKTGRVGRVCVLRADAAVLAHLGAQALRGWRFKPATQGGEPTEVFYNITQNFTLK